jgi:adenine-specific DNA glycosylase
MGYTNGGIVHRSNARHTFTHRIWDMTGYDVYVKENHAIEDYRFLTPDEMDGIALPAAMKYFSHRGERYATKQIPRGNGK